LYRLALKVLGALAIVKPETVIKWHRARRVQVVLAVEQSRRRGAPTNCSA